MIQKNKKMSNPLIGMVAFRVSFASFAVLFVHYAVAIRRHLYPNTWIASGLSSHLHFSNMYIEQHLCHPFSDCC